MPTPARTLPLLLLVLAAACGLPRRPEIEQAVAAVDEERLRAHVEALVALGPRPFEDAEASAETLAWLEDQLAALGLTATRESVPLTQQLGDFVAEVRRPDGEPVELEVPTWYASYDHRVRLHYTAALKAEGWEVLGYSLANPGIGQVDVPNLLVEIPGTSGEAGIVEVAAHYDTVPGSPGADDNSTGVAALLEIARVLGEHPPEATVRLCFFSAEEADLKGSAVHVDNIVAADEPVEAVFNLDSIGFRSTAPDSQEAPVRILFVTWMPSTADFITVVGDWSSGWVGNLYEAAARTYVPELEYYSANRIGGWFEDGHRSDHANYWKAGIPAIMLTDTGNFRSAHYHAPSDLPETLDMAFVRQVTQATVAAVLEAARR